MKCRIQVKRAREEVQAQAQLVNLQKLIGLKKQEERFKRYVS